jgi:hypothetical protein
MRTASPPRSRRLTRAILLAACLPAACGPGPDDPIRRILEAARTDAGAFEKLAHLTDRIGPRLSGSRNLEEAVRWAAAELERDGADRVWTEPVTVPHWVRGAESGKIVAPVEHPVALKALGGSDPTPEGGIAAEVLEVAGIEELRAKADAARGRIVLFNRPIRRNGAGPEGYGSASRLRTRGPSEAAKLGAVGALIRSLGTASYRLPHTGATTHLEGAPRIPAAAVSAEDADLIHRLLAAGETVRVSFTLGCRTLPDAESANVLAELRGASSPEEIVLIGAHLDSWDLGTGAIDDGAGVAIVMETVRLLRSLDLRPRRTIRAVLFTNEENGLRGARAYAAAHRDEIARHVAAFESDSGAGAPLGFGVSAGPGGEGVVRFLASRLTGIGAGSVRRGGGGGGGGRRGGAGGPLVSVLQDGTYYFDYHHSAADTLDKVDGALLARNVAALAAMAYAVADMPGTLPRQEPKPEAEERRR